MSKARRCIIRTAASSVLAPPQRQRRLQNLRGRLEHEQAALARWQKRLKRALNTVSKCHKAVARLQRQLAQLEG
jgi:hypothetical protein